MRVPVDAHVVCRWLDGLAVMANRKPSRAWKDAGKKWGTGGSSGWAKTKAAVIARDGGVCRLAVDAGCSGSATTAHHTVGRAKTGDDMQYLIAACNHCNFVVGDPTRHDPKPLERRSFFTKTSRP